MKILCCSDDFVLKKQRSETERRDMIKGLAGLPQNGGNKIENFWAWKSAEEKQKICKITNSATKRNRRIVLVYFS